MPKLIAYGAELYLFFHFLALTDICDLAASADGTTGAGTTTGAGRGDGSDGGDASTYRSIPLLFMVALGLAEMCFCAKQAFCFVQLVDACHSISRR